MLQGADLEHVRVVPALAQRGVGEDEPRRLLEAEQALLVLQDQVIGGNVVAELAAALQLGIHRPPGLLVDAEIAPVGLVGVDAVEVREVGRVEQCAVIVDYGVILFLKHAPIFAEGLHAVRVILAVLGDLVDEEQGQALDVLGEQLSLLLQV